jgi:hypothetical protein
MKLCVLKGIPYHSSTTDIFGVTSRILPVSDRRDANGWNRLPVDNVAHSGRDTATYVQAYYGIFYYCEPGQDPLNERWSITKIRCCEIFDPRGGRNDTVCARSSL